MPSSSPYPFVRASAGVRLRVRVHMCVCLMALNKNLCFISPQQQPHQQRRAWNQRKMTSRRKRLLFNNQLLPRVLHCMLCIPCLASESEFCKHRNGTRRNRFRRFCTLYLCGIVESNCLCCSVFLSSKGRAWSEHVVSGRGRFYRLSCGH